MAQRIVPTKAVSWGRATRRRLRVFVHGTGRWISVARLGTSLIVFAGAWELLVRALNVSPFILPPPSEILESLANQVAAGSLHRHVGVTVFETAVGFLIGSALGVVFGTTIAMSSLIRTFVYPYVIGLNSIPKIALAPLMVTWFGFGLTSKIVMAVLICLFPVLVNTIVGLGAVESQLLDLMRGLDASQWQVFRRIRVPSALPYIFAGLEIGAVVSVIGAIVGEFIGGSVGLGFLLVLFNSRLQVASGFSILIVLGAFGMLLHRSVLFARERLVHWADEAQSVEGPSHA